MPDEDKTSSGSLFLDLRIWWRHLHTLYNINDGFLIAWHTSRLVTITCTLSKSSGDIKYTM